MSNITLAVDDGILAEVRQIAARKGTTVNAMVREHLEQIARNQSRVKEAMRELRELSENSNAELGPVTWKREDLYDR